MFNQDVDLSLRKSVFSLFAMLLVVILLKRKEHEQEEERTVATEHAAATVCFSARSLSSIG
jgi:hypothetical protein